VSAFALPRLALHNQLAGKLRPKKDSGWRASTIFFERLVCGIVAAIAEVIAGSVDSTLAGPNKLKMYNLRLNYIFSPQAL
jgi:hypothetical protein